MAEVLVLPGIERRDLCGEELPAVQVLTAAIEQGVTDVVIVGRHRNGEQYVAGSIADIDKAVGVLFSAATWLASGNYAQGIADPDDDQPEEPA